jgi:hypothetical protein
VGFPCKKLWWFCARVVPLSPIPDTYSRSSVHAPETVANPRTPNFDSTFLGTLCDEPAADWQGVKTRWELVDGRMAFESWAVRDMARALAVAEVREEIMYARGVDE